MELDEGGQRFSPITPTDHAGLIWITSILALVFSVLAFIGRLAIKFYKWGSDDTACAIATVLGIASFAAIASGLEQGLGKSRSIVSDSQINASSKALFSSQILLLLTQGITRISVILLIKRCFAKDMTVYRRICDGMIASVAVIILGSITGISVNCRISGLLENTTACPRQPVRWEVIGIFDSIIEIIIVISSAALFWGNKRLSLAQKCLVVGAFSFRLLSIPIIVVHIFYYFKINDVDADVPLDMTAVIITEQVAIGISLLTATIPNMKSFLLNFHSQLGTGVGYVGVRQPITNTDASQFTTTSQSSIPNEHADSKLHTSTNPSESNKNDDEIQQPSTAAKDLP